MCVASENPRRWACQVIRRIVRGGPGTARRFSMMACFLNRLTWPIRTNSTPSFLVQSLKLESGILRRSTAFCSPCLDVGGQCRRGVMSLAERLDASFLVLPVSGPPTKQKPPCIGVGPVGKMVDFEVLRYQSPSLTLVIVTRLKPLTPVSVLARPVANPRVRFQVGIQDVSTVCGTWSLSSAGYRHSCTPSASACISSTKKMSVF